MAIDLSDVSESNQGGIYSLSGLKYQYHYAVYQSLEMIAKPDEVAYVACELQEDVSVRLCNGFLKFYQTKERRGRLWSFSDLTKVWEHFWWLRNQFGDNTKFHFISDQDFSFRTSKGPDLGKMRSLTDKGEKYCDQMEIIVADEFIEKLKNLLSTNDKSQVEDFFWSIRLIKESSKQDLISKNLILLEQILSVKGIETDIYSRKRIYNCLVSLFENTVDVYPSDADYKVRLEQREVSAAQIWNEIMTGPHKKAQPKNFNLVDNTRSDRDLRTKCEEVNFQESLILFLLESRNMFECRYRQDTIYSANYIMELRFQVFNVCSEANVLSHINTDGDKIKTYRNICEELKKLAIEEQKKNPPIVVDYLYLHGMLCQLTAQCHNNWYLI